MHTIPTVCAPFIAAFWGPQRQVLVAGVVTR